MVRTAAAPAPTTLRDLAIPPERLLEIRAVKVVLNSAKGRARRRSSKSTSFVTRASTLLACGFALTPDDLAARCGLHSKVAIRRASVALVALVDSGFAMVREGRYALNDVAILRAIQAG